MNRPVVYIVILVLLGLSALPLLPVVRGSTTKTWTTTADFDAGTKLDLGPQLTTYFANNGVDQPTLSFISSPTAIYVPAVKRTYTVWEGTSNYLPYMTYYDHTTGLWATPVQVSNINPVSGDGHGSPAMWVDSSGYIWVFWGSHNSAQKLAISTEPYSISSWTMKADAAPFASYPHLFEYGGYVYFMYRLGNLSWTWEKSNDRGASWVAGNVFLVFVGGVNGWYLYHHELFGSRLYYTMVQLQEPSEYRFGVYVCYWDLSNDHQYGVDGADLGPAISVAEANSHCRAVDEGQKHVWADAMRLDSSGRPYLIYDTLINGTANSWDVNYTRWNGSAWSAPLKITSTDGSSSYADMIVESPSSIRAYITTAGLTDVAGDDFSGDLEEWRWNGTAWGKIQTILSESTAGDPVNRPYVPLNFQPDLRIVFDTWEWRGQNAFLTLYAWGDNGFLPSRLTGVFSPVETQTDNAGVPAGQVGVWTGTGDTFSQANPTANSAKWKNIMTGDGAGSPFFRFDGSVFAVSYNGSAGSGRKGDSLIGTFAIQGNFDVRIKFNVPDTVETGSLSEALCMLSDPNACDPTSGPLSQSAVGVMYRYFTSPINLFRAYNVSVANVFQVGSDTSAVCDPCWLRLARSGNTVTFYWSLNGSSWTTDETYTFSPAPSTWYVSFGPDGNLVTSGSWRMNTDDYYLAAGTLSQGGYGRSGSWKSNLQTYTGDRSIVTSVHLDYSASGGNWTIGPISVLNATGAVLYQDAAVIANGSSVDIPVPMTDENILALRSNWTIKIPMTGTGNAGVSVLSVTATLSTESTVGEVVVEGATNAFWLLLFVSFCAVIVFGAWVVRERFL